VLENFAVQTFAGANRILKHVNSPIALNAFSFYLKIIWV